MKKLWERPILYIGLVVVVAVIGGLVFGAKTSDPATITVHPGDFVQEVSVSGKVVAARDVDLGFSQGGRVARVYTSVGAHVPGGALLVELENADLRAALESAEATLSSLRAGTRPEEIAVAEADVTSSQSALADANRDAYTTADNAVRQTLDQFISNPRSSSPTLTFATSDSGVKAAVESGRAMIEPALVAGAVDLGQVSSLLASASAAIARAIPNGSITQAVLDGYAADVAAARTSVNAASASVTSAEAALNAATKNLALKQAGATPDTIAVEEARVREAEANLQKTMIVAPFSGTVTALYAKVGATLVAGGSALSLIGYEFQIETYIPEVNIALVSRGNPASATLDAYGDEIIFPARVVAIDPAETERDGISTYRTILSFTSVDNRIRAGMTANVRIVTAERTNVISVPQGVVRTRDGKKYVSVMDGESVIDREVTVGAVSSVGTVEITSGLADGDVVVTSQP